MRNLASRYLLALHVPWMKAWAGAWSGLRRERAKKK